MLRRFTRDEICAPCGANTDCEVGFKNKYFLSLELRDSEIFYLSFFSQVGPDDRPICRCKATYIGNPLQVLNLSSLLYCATLLPFLGHKSMTV